MKKITLTFAAIAAALTMNAQDTCATAISVTDGVYTVDAVDGEGGPACFETNTAEFAEWFYFTAGTEDVSLTISTDLDVNEGGDTRLSVFAANETCGAFTSCTASSDDIDFIAVGDPNNNLLSSVTFLAEAGSTYYFVFDSQWSATGFDFEVTSSTDIPDAPLAVSNPTPVDGATNVTVDPTDNDGDGTPDNIVNVAWTPATTGEAATSYDLYLSNPSAADPTALNLLGTTDNTSVNITGMTEGDTYYWQIVAKNVGGEATDSETWEFTTATLGLNDTKKLSFDYFVNNNSSLVVSSESALKHIKLYNILGQEVISKKLDAKSVDINLNSLNSGVYLVQVEIEGQSKSFKIVKK